MRLYKYMRVLDSVVCSEMNNCNQYKKAGISEQTQKMLRESRIYFSDPVTFNDPFDGYYSIKFSSDKEKETAKKELDDCLSKMVKEKTITYERAEEIKKNIFIQLPLENYRVSCFARNDENDLMWAHYADQHKGVCLVYEIDELQKDLIAEDEKRIYVEKVVDNNICIQIKEGTILLGEVMYREEKPCLEFANGKVVKSFNKVLPLYTKSKIWQYENEVRLVAQIPIGNTFENEKYFCKIDKRCLKEIRFGVSLEDKYQKELEKIIEESGYDNVLLYKAAVDPFSLKLKMIPFVHSLEQKG